MDGQDFFHQLPEAQLLQHGRHGKQAALVGKVFFAPKSKGVEAAIL